jgi:predicted nucleic acid-binding protein
MREDRKSLYVESTIPSYVTARTSRDPITAGHQAATKLFWETERHKYDLYISQYVIDEIRDGDRDAAKKRLDLVEGIPVYPKTAETDSLAEIYQKLLGIPDRAKADCIHLAVCVLERINYLLTWNCAHLGVASQINVQYYNDQHGLWVPTLAMPEALMPDLFKKENLI